MTPRDPSLLTSDELAEYLGLSVKTIKRWRVQGKGPRALQLAGTGTSVRYRVSDVDAWLETQDFPTPVRRRRRRRAG
jgi:excisionase family DNA binding protein